ncbi:MAG TPA: hypothetical protein H9999_01425 [Candidatus Negativibacillus faecipullorum]|nr:hypothetical protein [Candidatus Negativibacillus faecipullorum]
MKEKAPFWLTEKVEEGRKLLLCRRFLEADFRRVPFGKRKRNLETTAAWELFLLQKVPQSARELSLADFPFKRRLNDKAFRALRSSTSRRCPLDTCSLLKKGWRKLLIYFTSV